MGHNETSRTKQDFSDWHEGSILYVMGPFGTTGLELEVDSLIHVVVSSIRVVRPIFGLAPLFCPYSLMIYPLSSCLSVYLDYWKDNGGTLFI